jgi:hypothetical protein
VAHPTTPEKQAAAKEVVRELINGPYWERLQRQETTVSEIIQALGTTCYHMLGLYSGSMSREPDAGEQLTSIFNEVVPGAFPWAD